MAHEERPASIPSSRLSDVQAATQQEWRARMQVHTDLYVAHEVRRQRATRIVDGTLQVIYFLVCALILGLIAVHIGPGNLRVMAMRIMPF